MVARPSLAEGSLLDLRRGVLEKRRGKKKKKKRGGIVSNFFEATVVDADTASRKRERKRGRGNTVISR